VILPLSILFAISLDYLFGEVRRFHPLVGFGNVASRLENKLNISQLPQKLTGMLCWLVLVLPLPVIIWNFSLSENWMIVINVTVIYFAIGLDSLKSHVLNVYDALKSDDVDLARERISMIVSRETKHMDEAEISRAAVETTLENGHDAVIATLFWFIVGGAPMVILHRLANTLDAMWGYRNVRFNQFGWFAAKADDLLGFPSAFVSGLTYLLVSKSSTYDKVKSVKRSVYQCLKYKSLNGGWTMATGASALKLSLGGKSTYSGVKIEGNLLGAGSPPDINDIKSSISLVYKSTLCLAFSYLILVLALPLIKGIL